MRGSKADARALTENLQAAPARIAGFHEGALPEAGPGVGFLLSPILRLSEGQLLSTLAIGPLTYRRYFYEDPVREQLRAPEIHALAAEIYAGWFESPAQVLTLTRDTAVDVYETGYRFEDERPATPLARFESHGLDHLPMLSRILAALGRDLAAELTPDEIRARWADMNPESANAKLMALREREDVEISRAYGFDE